MDVALLQLLDGYLVANPAEHDSVEKVRALVLAHDDCFERSCIPGHITGSAWVVSPDHRAVLLTHHRKLDRWLQLGGHADGQTDVLQVALREVEEESGLRDLTIVSPLPFDIDVHLIPARANEPAHFHHDFRFLLVAAPAQELRISEESHDLRWIERARLHEISSEESILRMERKAAALLPAP